jgi:hypothetical protein
MVSPYFHRVGVAASLSKATALMQARHSDVSNQRLKFSSSASRTGSPLHWQSSHMTAIIIQVSLFPPPTPLLHCPRTRHHHVATPAVRLAHSLQDPGTTRLTTQVSTINDSVKSCLRELFTSLVAAYLLWALFFGIYGLLKASVWIREIIHKTYKALFTTARVLPLRRRELDCRNGRFITV